MKKKLGSILLAAALVLGTAMQAFATEGFVGSPTLDPGASVDHQEIIVVKGDEKTVEEAELPIIAVTPDTEEVVAVNTAYTESKTTTEFFESYGAAAARDAQAAAGGQDLDSYVQVRTVDVFANQLAIEEAAGDEVNVTFAVPGVEEGDVVMVAFFVKGKYVGSYKAVARKGEVVFPVNLKNLGTYMILKQVKK